MIRQHAHGGRVARSVAVALSAAVVAGQFLWGVTPAQAAGGDITTACAGAPSGSTFTLTADCDTTATLTVPNGMTLDGGGHTITAHDAGTAPGGLFSGPVVTNAGASMTVTNLTVRGTGFANALPTGCQDVVGVQFTDASGTISNVTVADITQHSTCMTVHGIVLRSALSPQTVTMTGVTVTDYQRTGLLVIGQVTIDVTGSTFGPPDLTVPGPGGIAQNTVQVGSPQAPGPTTGVFADNTVYGTGFGTLAAVSTGMLIFDTDNLTITRNTFGGAGTDRGISLLSARNTTISYNAIDRAAPNRPGYQDDYGEGVNADGASAPTTTLICNTFAGWNHNLVNATQPLCIQPPALPCAVAGTPFSAHLHAITANPTAEPTWSVASGHLPPGLTLHPDGTITGTATTPGTYQVTVEVSDPADGTATREITLCVTPAQAGPAPSHGAGPPGQVSNVATLPATGSPVWPLVLAATVLIGIGTVLLLARRRGD